MLRNRAGMEIIEPEFRGVGALALKAAFMMPPRVREALFFGTSIISIPLQKALVSALGGSFTAVTKFTDGPMSGLSFSCLTAEKYFFLGSHVESDFQRRLREFIRPGDVVYDIGGHIGYMCLIFSVMAGPEGRVFTFEPSPTNFPRLTANLNANARLNVTPINAAVSCREGNATFEEGGSMSTVVLDAHANNNESLKVRTIRVDDFVYRDSHPPPGFIKLDVEGHAGPAVEGMQRVLRLRRTRIICELHNRSEEEQFAAALSPVGYHVISIDRYGRFPRRVAALPD